MPPEEQLINVLVLRRTGLQAADIGWIKEWRPDQLLQHLCDTALGGWCDLPNQHSGPIRNAFRKASQSGNREALLEHLSAAVIQPVQALWDKRGLLFHLARQSTWYPLLSTLRAAHGHDYFWANIVAFDLRTQRLANAYPRDRQVYCGFGPGGLRGLNAVLGRARTAALEQQVALLWAKYLADTLAWPGPRPEAYLVQWWLCELSQAPTSIWSTG
ncbi:unnamed protein product [Symbiodinium sp. CCMP2456]|nr:unnamed protein product [Symbiodinium sp. CCMP2456]